MLHAGRTAEPASLLCARMSTCWESQYRAATATSASGRFSSRHLLVSAHAAWQGSAMDAQQYRGQPAPRHVQGPSACIAALVLCQNPLQLRV